jgi:hypothetical protein
MHANVSGGRADHDVPAWRVSNRLRPDAAHRRACRRSGDPPSLRPPRSPSRAIVSRQTPGSAPLQLHGDGQPCRNVTKALRAGAPDPPISRRSRPIGIAVCAARERWIWTPPSSQIFSRWPAHTRQERQESGVACLSFMLCSRPRSCCAREVPLTPRVAASDGRLEPPWVWWIPPVPGRFSRERARLIGGQAGRAVVHRGS